MNRFFGGDPLGVILRLIILSIIVGIVLSALGIRPDNFFYSLELLAWRVYNMGFGAIEWMLGYLLLGAMIVVPVWLIARVFGVIGGRGERDDRR